MDVNGELKLLCKLKKKKFFFFFGGGGGAVGGGGGVGLGVRVDVNGEVKFCEISGGVRVDMNGEQKLL